MSERAPLIRIHNWDRFQHYKKRNPPWIRLYRDLIDRPEYRQLSDAAARLLVELWLLASEFEPGGTIPMDIALLAWRTGRASTDASIVASLQELHRQGFIVLPNRASADASAFASTSTPQRQRTEDRGQSLTPPARACEDENREPDKLAEWLGPYAVVINSCGFLEPDQLPGLLMQYGPSEMRMGAWKKPDGGSVDPEHRPRLLAAALASYAAEGRRTFVANEFAGMLRRIIADEFGEGGRRGRAAPAEPERSGFVSYDRDYEPGGIYYVPDAADA